MATGWSMVGPSRPLVTSPIRCTVSRMQLDVFTHRNALPRLQPDTFRGWAPAYLQFRQNFGRTRESPGASATGAAHLLDRPLEAGFDRRGRAVNVVAVRQQTGFQPQ